MGGLEVVVVATGLIGMAAFTSLAMYFAERRAARQAHLDRPLPELEARLLPAGVPLKVNVLTDAGPGDYGTRIVVEGVCARLTLRRERPAEQRTRLDSMQLRPAPPAPELETGDPDFDGVFFVLGPPAVVHAILDAETRRRLLALTVYQEPGSIVAENGRLCVNLPLSHGLHPHAVEERGRQAVALAQRLLEPQDVARRLAENAQHDPLARVRLRNLSAALREAPDDPLIRAALRAAAADGDLEVRLRAGLALGPEGRDALLSVAESPAADDAAVETALDALGAEVPIIVLARVLRRAVGEDLGAAPAQPRAARACINAVARSTAADAVSRLRSFLLANEFLGADVARALGRRGGEEAEAALVSAVNCDVFASRLAAAHVLGEFGTTAAVAALREAEGHGGEMGRAARAAIAEIQARATGTPGAVSLARNETDQGQLALADEAPGQVSLPPRDDGRGSE